MEYQTILTTTSGQKIVVAERLSSVTEKLRTQQFIMFFLYKRSSSAELESVVVNSNEIESAKTFRQAPLFWKTVIEKANNIQEDMLVRNEGVLFVVCPKGRYKDCKGITIPQQIHEAICPVKIVKGPYKGAIRVTYAGVRNILFEDNTI